MPAKDDLRLLLKQERSLRISVDNIKEFVQSTQGGADRRSVDMRIARLDDIWKQFIDVRMRIELITDDVDDEISTDEAEESEEARLQRQVRNRKNRDRENSKVIKDFENEVYRLKESMFGLLPSTSSSALQVQPHPTVAVPQSKVKLPELKLPTFSGRMSDWVTFRDTYKNLIHNDASLSNMDKFTYLRTSLIGDALQEIASIEISSANYTIAWKALENVYENKKLLVMTHLDSLFALEPLRQESFESLSKLVNGFEKNLQMLMKIGENPEGWSTLLQYMLCKRLHPTTLRHWESHYSSKEVPKYEDLVKFLKSHCSVLQSIAPVRQFQAEPKKIVRPSTSHAGIQSSGCCPFCGESAHSAFKCSKFSKMRVSERVDAVRKSALCLNCLSPAHIARFCTRGACHQCGQRHHSLLHANSSTTANQNKPGPFHGNQSNKKPQGQNTQPPQAKPTQNGHSTNTQPTQHSDSATNSATNVSNAHSHTSATDSPSTSYHAAPSVHTHHVPHTVLLSTAVVNLYDQYGNSLIARALLDSGSQRCYMSENISQKLKFKRTREHLPIVGIGGSRTASTQAIFAEVHSLVTNYVTNLKFHVLPRVTVDLPTRSIDIRSWNIPKEIVLADPTFNESGAVDLIIGAEVYLELMIAERQIKLGDTGPTLQDTLLGWIVSGGIPEESTSLTTVSSCATENIEEGLARFFELESCRTTNTLSLEESACELHFERTTTRDSSDDMLKSVDSIDEGVQLSKDLIHVLGTAGLTLRKWSSNSREIMDSIPPYLRDERSSLDLEPSNSTVKTLGLKWEPRLDVFRFTVPQWNPAIEINKRIILSDFAKLFDPLGLVGPTLVQAKVFLQDLWRTKCSWNETLPDELQTWWREFRDSLEGLSQLQVPRWVAFGSDTISAELHMFCDASKKAYGACIYLRCTSFDGRVTASLLTAKSRVAPLEDLEKKRKQTSIPRLELSSALTGVHLFEKVVQSIKITAQPYFWTDSMIVKCWIASPPSRWNMFVANRVSEIQHITRGGIWNHIAGLENPADVLSRGMTPDLLKDYEMWWQGPPWLRLDKTSWPKTATINPEDLDPSLLEERITVSAPAQVVEPSPIFGLRSSLDDLIRIVVLIRRFVHNCKNRQDRRIGFVNYQERAEALHQLLHLAQQESFPEDIVELQRNGEVKSTSRINPLTPRLVNGLILVGGRLANANISASRKHPIVLDSQHPLSVLIATDYHRKHLHAGQQLLIASMRERYWPIAARNLARMVIHRCVKCFRTRPKHHEQLMADLPSERVTPAPPFLRVGVDYCGPFYIQHPYRKGTPIKCFVAVFVCLVVKAVHLEIVGDLTSQAFIAALRRFVARRGRPEIIMCDNATNFIGARRELDELRKLFNNQEFARTVAEETAMDNINFKFIPAKSPNFGGLWEAAVKSMKGHLKRTLGTTVISSDEMATLVTQIEACLNSRPITPLSNDPNDMEILTPGHFLVGRPLTEIPEPSLQDLNESRLSRWQRVQNFFQHIWRRWSTQYLSDLQARTKWTRQRNNLFIGTMVLLCEDNVPPLKWRMGRVIDSHLGKDGNIRVVKVRTKDGEFLRAISKICVLPIRDNEATSASTHEED